MELRRLAAGDEALLANAAELLSETSSADPAPFLADADAVVIVALAEEAPVGWSWGRRVVRPDGRSMFLLYDVEVVAAHRRQGIGLALVEETKQAARALGCEDMWLVTEANNPAAVATYRAAGGTWSDAADLVVSWDLGDD